MNIVTYQAFPIKPVIEETKIITILSISKTSIWWKMMQEVKMKNRIRIKKSQKRVITMIVRVSIASMARCTCRR